MLQDFHRYKLVILALVALNIGWVLVTPSHALNHFLHSVLLPIHEAGHLMHTPFNKLSIMLAGGLWQTLLPVAFVFYFYSKQQSFAASLTLFLVAFSLLDTGFYAADAQARALPLITYDIATHDWWNILRIADILEYTPVVKILFYLQAWIVFIGACVLGFRASKK